MTITTTIAAVSGASTESVTVQVADKTSPTLISADIDPKTQRATAIYALTSDYPGYPITLTVNSDPPGAKSRYCSVTLRTWIVQSSDVTDESEYWPIQASTSFVVPGDAPLLVADLVKLMGVAFSYTYLSVAAGVRETTWLATILKGSPQVL